MPMRSPCQLDNWKFPDTVPIYTLTDILRGFFVMRLILNILWLLFGGIWSAIAWFLVGIVAAITIVGLP
ncbi:MAG: YccF domain-containing protein, partial [Pseudomonadota bacterium]